MQRPVLAALKALDLFLALDDQAQRRTLHTAGREARLDLAPQHRRQVEADQVVERPPRLLRVDQGRQHLAWVLYRVLDRRLCHFVEHHALHRFVGSGLVAMKDL